MNDYIETLKKAQIVEHQALISADAAKVEIARIEADAYIIITISVAMVVMLFISGWVAFLYVDYQRMMAPFRNKPK